MGLIGRKRSREESGEDEEYLELLNPSKRLKLSEDFYVPRMRSFQRERKTRLRRSNSIDRLGGRLSIADRYTVNTGLKKDSMKDYSVIAVFSREAFENFGKKWKTKMNVDTLDIATKSSLSKVSTTEHAKLLSRQSKSVLGTDFQEQVQTLFENKTIPHVIAVIEGKEERATFSLKTKVDEKSIDVLYTRLTYVQGTNAKGSSDNKQSMSIYVRNDMKGVYSVSEESITHYPTGKSISSLGVNYATEDGTKYRTLLVHIPNEFVGTSTADSNTHDSFQQYATKQGIASSPVIVTSYFGDTNYSSSMGRYTSPSMGGHSSLGTTLNPQSSGAQKETHFMQSVAVSDGHSSHSVFQPSTLNYVFINPDSVNREATDHPSIIQYVAHSSELAGNTSSKGFELIHYYGQRIV